MARVNCQCVIRFHNAFFEEIMHRGQLKFCCFKESKSLSNVIVSGKRIFEVFIVTDYGGGRCIDSVI